MRQQTTQTAISYQTLICFDMARDTVGSYSIHQFQCLKFWRETDKKTDTKHQVDDRTLVKLICPFLWHFNVKPVSVKYNDQFLQKLLAAKYDDNSKQIVRQNSMAHLAAISVKFAEIY